MKLSKIATKLGTGLTYSALMAGTALANHGIPHKLEDGAAQAKPTGATDTLPEIFGNIANVLIFLVGAIAVIMLIVGGLRYVISGGDPKNVEGAKNTIFYAIIGIVVAILAYAAVNFVINQLQ